jgi:hypothetical protein
MASPAPYGAVPAVDVRVKVGPSTSTRCRASMGAIVSAVVTVRPVTPVSHAKVRYRKLRPAVVRSVGEDTHKGGHLDPSKGFARSPHRTRFSDVLDSYDQALKLVPSVHDARL